MVSPDGTSNHFEYSCCGLDWTRDRLNRVTSFTRDALGRTTSVTDPENRLVEFRYNGADQITNLITWVAGQPRVKRFDYTSTNGFTRLTKVITPWPMRYVAFRILPAKRHETCVPFYCVALRLSHGPRASCSNTITPSGAGWPGGRTATGG